VLGAVIYIQVAGGPTESHPHGPSITAAAIGLDGGALVNLSGAHVTVFSNLPNSLLTDYSAVPLSAVSVSNNSYYVELWNGTTGANGVATGVLSPLFNTIVAQWLHVAGPMTDTVSLTVEGTYVTSNNTTERLYNFYDNYPFSPRAPPTQVRIPVVFNLNHPTGTYPVPMGSRAPVVPALCTPSTCPTCSTQTWDNWTTLNTTTKTGPLPIMLANNSDPANSDLFLAIQQTFSATFKLNFTSAQAVSTKMVTMSTHSSWSGSSPGGGTGGAAVANPASNASVGMIFLNNATINIVNQKEVFTRWVFNPTEYKCVTSSTTTLYDTEKITGISGGSFAFHGESEDHCFGEILTKLEFGSSLALIYNHALNATDTTTYSTLTATDTSYSSASSAIDTIEGAWSVFSSALALSLAIMDAFDVCGIFCGAGDVATTITDLTAEVGFAMTMFSALQSISFSVTQSTYIQQVTYQNNQQGASPGPYEVFLYDSGFSTSFTAPNGTEYNPNMPGMITYACAVGTSPGYGC